MNFPGLIGPSYSAFSPKADFERSLNCYRARVESDQGINPFVLYRSPGLLPYITSLKTGPVRGMLARDTSAKHHAFIVVDDTVYDMLETTITTSYSPISSDGAPVYMAASPTTLMIVSNGHLYRINSGALTEITPGPAFTVLNVKFLKNYFIVLYSDLQQFGWSSDDGATFPADNVQTFESDANAVKTMEVIHKQLFLVGTRITQVYYVGGNPNAPFVENDSGEIPSGTKAPASLRALGGALFWLDSNQDGQGRVMMCEGYTARQVSNLAVENAIRGYGVKDDAIGIPYELNGQQFYRLTFPTADKTWEYNKTLNEWTEISWYRWRLGTHHRHRAMSVMAAFDRILVGDHTNGIVYEMSPDIHHDFGFPLKLIRRAPHIIQENKWVSYDRLELGIETGVGLTVPLWLNDYSLQKAAFDTAVADLVTATTITQAEADVLTQIYDSEPYTPLDPYPAASVMDALGFYPWGAALTLNDETIGSPPLIGLQQSSIGGRDIDSAATLTRSLGNAGEYGRRVYWDRGGVARDKVYQLTYDAPCRFALTAAFLEAQEL